MEGPYDNLKGDDLDAAVADAGIDASTGGSNTDGSLSADEKREALQARAEEDRTAPDISDDERYGGADEFDRELGDTPGLSGDERAAAQALPLTPPERDRLRDAHARGDTDEIAYATAEINARREAEYADSRQ